MRRAAALLLAAALLASGPAIAGGGHGGGHGGGGHGHGGHHGWGGGWHHGFNSGFGATFVYGPWFWDPYFFPYAPAYYYPTYVPPPDDVDVPDAAPTGWSTEGDAENPLDASYGLIQLQGVPDGASVELDGRYWMGAARLGERWLALPRGRHTLTVRGTDGATQERLLDVAPGTTVVVQF